MLNKILNQTQLIQWLNELCLNQKTGTLFMSVHNSHAAGFVIKVGEITYCFFDHWRNHEALQHIKNIALAKCNFSEKVLFSFIDHSTQLSTINIFNELGYTYEPLPNIAEKVTRIYRGNIVYNNDFIEENLPKIADQLSSTETNDTKKAKRIYRGQIF